MNIQQIKQAALNEVGAKGTPAQYQAAMDRLSAGIVAADEPRCAVTGLTADEKVSKAKDYAKEHGVDLVAALKALGFAK